MEESILTSTKKILNISEDDTSFDQDIITHINTAFSHLHQLGIGPDAGFYIEDADKEWSEFTEDHPFLASVRTYIYLKVRLVFDPPNTPFVLTSMEKQITEHEVRLNIDRETTEWVDPDPVDPDLPEDEYGEPVIIDGGDA